MPTLPYSDPATVLRIFRLNVTSLQLLADKIEEGCPPLKEDDLDDHLAGFQPEVAAIQESFDGARGRLAELGIDIEDEWLDLDASPGMEANPELAKDGTIVWYWKCPIERIAKWKSIDSSIERAIRRLGLPAPLPNMHQANGGTNGQLALIPPDAGNKPRTKKARKKIKPTFSTLEAIRLINEGRRNDRQISEMSGVRNVEKVRSRLRNGDYDLTS